MEPHFLMQGHERIGRHGAHQDLLLIGKRLISMTTSHRLLPHLHDGITGSSP